MDELNGEADPWRAAELSDGPMENSIDGDGTVRAERQFLGIQFIITERF